MDENLIPTQQSPRVGDVGLFFKSQKRISSFSTLKVKTKPLPVPILSSSDEEDIILTPEEAAVCSPPKRKASSQEPDEHVVKIKEEIVQDEFDEIIPLLIPPKVELKSPETPTTVLTQRTLFECFNNIKKTPKIGDNKVGDGPESDKDFSPTFNSTQLQRTCDVNNSIASIAASQTIKADEPNKSKKVNYYYTQVFNDFYTHVNSGHLKHLLQESENVLLEVFFMMPINYQYVCIKLFMWKPVWRNVLKFVEDLGLKMDAKSEILPMLEYLDQQGFVYGDYSNEDFEFLLNQLDMKRLKELAQTFKIPHVKLKKEQLIEKLIKMTKNQATLTFSADMKEVLRQNIKMKMGYCFKISQNLKNSLFKTFLLNTFTNKAITRVDEYFHQEYMRYLCYPSFIIEDMSVFEGREEFRHYSEAVSFSHRLEFAIKDKKFNAVTDIGTQVLSKLQTILGQSLFGNVDRPEYLERYSAVSKLMSVLIEGAVFITPKDYPLAQEWLEYLYSETKTHCKWKKFKVVKQLSLIYTKYCKDHEESAKILIEALECGDLSERQKHELFFRCNVVKRRKCNLPQMYLDKIATAQPPADEAEFTQVSIDAQPVRTHMQQGQKRKYLVYVTGERHYLDVEDVALRHYRSLGYPKGIHCEGRLILCLFNLLFWDIIYDHYVKGAFVSKYQTVPLDMYTRFFYKNREEAVNRRIQEIESKLIMSDETLKRFLNRIYREHARESSLICSESFLADSDLSEVDLFQVIMCIERKVLSKIFKRLVINFGEHASGLPDLFMWNPETKMCKFVEIKGHGDKLQINQTLWIKYLQDIGAAVEVCHVHSTGEKRRVLK